MDSKNYAI